MFYIKQFFLIVRENSFKGGVFILVSILFISIMGLWPLLKDEITGLYPDYLDGPSFYALINSDQNYPDIQRKLISLPGISSVIIKNQDNINREAQKIIENFKLENEDLGTINYVALHVMFDRNISLRGQALIRNYLVKLAGESNITLGKIKYPLKNDGIKIILDLINVYGEWFLFFLFGMFWFFLLVVIKNEIKKISYLIEQFQRKNAVGIKILLSGMFLIYSLSIIFLSFFTSFQWINVGVIGLFFLVAILLSGGKKKWGY